MSQSRPKNPKRFFHVTSPEASGGILREGLRANADGKIYVLTALRFANNVARDQLCLARYSVVEIDPRGITGVAARDNVAEATANWHLEITQHVIQPEFLRLRKADERTRPLPFGADFEIWRRRGFGREELRKMFAGLWEDYQRRQIASECDVSSGSVDPTPAVPKTRKRKRPKGREAAS